MGTHCSSISLNRHTQKYSFSKRNILIHRQHIKMPAKQFAMEKAVFLQGIPTNVDRKKLYCWLKTLGWVRKFDLPAGDINTNDENKGYAYVHFKKRKEAEALIAKGRVKFRGRFIKVSPYKDYRTSESSPIKNTAVIETCVSKLQEKKSTDSGFTSKNLASRCRTPLDS